MHKITVLASLTTCLFFCSSLSAQEESEAPNYEQIRQQTSNSRSSSYYPTLLDRFQQCDSTLTLEDYRNLYFGFALQEDFVPYQKENQSALEARTLLAKSGANADDCPTAIAKAQEALLDNPFDLPALSVIPICYYQMGDMENFHLWDSKLHGILEAITSTGDGESEQTAYHVISIEHEYEILNRMGLELDQVEVINGQTDFVRVKSNNDTIPGIYFNFGACRKVYSQKYGK